MKIEIRFIRHGKTRGNLSGRYVGRTDEELCETGIRELTGRIEESRETDIRELTGHIEESRGTDIRELTGRIEESRGTGRDIETEAVSDGNFGRAAVVFSSPMKRCLQTAKILYPSAKVVVIDGLRECDFGRFEYMNYEELNGDPDYQAWIDSGGVIGFPEGESLLAFKAREINAFEEIAERLSDKVGQFSDQGEQLGETEAHCCEYEGLTEAAIVCHGGSIMAIMEHFAEPARDYFSWQVGNGRGFRCIFDTEKWKKGLRCLDVVDKVG